MDTEPKASDPKPEDAASTGSETSSEPVAVESATSAPVSDAPLRATGEHHYKILDDALAGKSTEQGRAYVHPVLFDCLLACGLLVAMGGFTIGLLKIYITHSAQQSITNQNYTAAIAILRGAPLPGLFTVAGSDPQELLNQALYLDAITKLDEPGNADDQKAIHELTQIQAGSKFFALAQEYIKDHTVPSDVQLQGNAEHEASPKDTPVEEELKIPAEPDGKSESH